MKVHRLRLPGRSLCSIRSNRKWCKRRGSSLQCQNCFFVYHIIDCNLKNCVYIDNYWLGGDESDVYHYVLGKGECITSELGYIIQDEGIPEDSKYIYYCIEGIDSKTNDKVQKYFKLEL